VLPVQAMSWHRVTLPQGSRSRGERGQARLRAILDGLLEDQLLDDPAQLHLAVQPHASSDTVWVAACDLVWLNAALTSLAQAGHAVDRIVPELSPDQLDGTWVVSGDVDQPLLAGLSADQTTALVAGLNPATVAWWQPASQVLAEPAVAAQAEVVLQRPVTLQTRTERWLQAAQSPWDLAQFSLAHARRDRRWASVRQGWAAFWRSAPWRPARWALVTLVVVNLVGLNALAFHERAALADKRHAVRAVLTDTFPKLPVVVDAPLQMAREVAALQRASGVAAGADLESMLASFQSLAQVDIDLSAIDYVAGELRVKDVPAAQADPLVAQLQAAGWRASVQGEQIFMTAGGAP